MYSIGIDIGGMSIKAGLVDENGKILEKNTVKSAATADEVIVNMAKQINSLLDNRGLTVENIKGIGIGCPGAISGYKGVVDILPNLGWYNVPLADRIKEYFDTEVRLSNDANVAALAEALYGCAKGYNDCIMLTLGTGVGGGIIINKKLYEGTECKGAELGHTTLIIDGEQCTCGRNGCVECYVSASALIRQTKAAMLSDRDSMMWDCVSRDIEKVDGKTAFFCAKQGDATAENVVSQYIKYLSESLMNMMNIFRPEVIILGGGICGEGKYLTDRIEQYCERFHYGYKGSPKPAIKIAELGNDAGIIGAAALLYQ